MGSYWIHWKEGFEVVSYRPKNKKQNRETLSHLYLTCTKKVQKEESLTFDDASRKVRAIWRTVCDLQPSKTLPTIIAEDGFLKMYALGLPVHVDLFLRLWKKIEAGKWDSESQPQPLSIEWNDPKFCFYDIDATPPGFLPKFYSHFRLKKDQQLLKCIDADLALVAQFEDPDKRKRLSLAILSHGAAYRELEGRTLQIPSFIHRDRLIAYSCKQHIIAQGVKTISLIPQEEGIPAIYLCQGTELWPSQPSVLGSILANFATHGSATEAYAHSWRLIHQHLRALPGQPIVIGHSMGGALAIQIGLYSHSLIDEVYAFNPPMPNARDYTFYHQLSSESQDKIHVSANLDDFAFWRIGAKVIGNITLYLGKKRWKYYPVNLKDCLLIFPAFIKFFCNVYNAFPAHQNIIALNHNWVSLKLTPEEIEKENQERISRFDYLHFFPKLYDPMKVFLLYVRRLFKWRLEKLLLRNEIELLVLHEKDLLDTLTEANRTQIFKEIRSLRQQKEQLLKKLYTA